MFKWFNASITRKVSSLSFVLLSFLFVVILYSVLKLQKINYEMREVAQIDVPLSDVISQIELIQLKQHLLMETIRQQKQALFDHPSLKKKALLGFNDYNRSLSEQLVKAMQVIQNGLKRGGVRIQVADHQTLIKQIRSLHIEREAFDHLVNQFFLHGDTDFSLHWSNIEKHCKKLDTQSGMLLKNIDQLTLKASLYTERQEQELMIVNAILGIAALFIGTYLTLYIVQSVRSRVGSIRWKIESLHRTLGEDSDEVGANSYQDLDEFSVLEADLNILTNRLSKERSNRYEVERQLIELATRDKLTGAYNRHKWDELLKEELALANRGGRFSLALIDVDYFKKINDMHGHGVGDKVLQFLVTELNKLIRETDMLFRIGGEEFAILLKNTGLDEAGKLAEALRLKVETFNTPSLPRFTISLGVTGSQESDDQVSILKRVDMLLYKAKGAGRNQVKIG
ncbi:putative diguanylate cyclase YdaM [Marinomonas spartinae]|uniref:diguanylate cyclase n=1 Tax=Marinomonas spartinae TaxID=1792290 RepID=A0A1A8TTX6_9GAMM|nr:GGDEF domain-containing protein [Marinomonas spartinae]SBS36969.1 putative diguanylate cyclase YdaM [Marinomonas spartinae]